MHAMLWIVLSIALVLSLCLRIVLPLLLLLLLLWLLLLLLLRHMRRLLWDRRSILLQDWGRGWSRRSALRDIWLDIPCSSLRLIWIVLRWWRRRWLVGRLRRTLLLMLLGLPLKALLATIAVVGVERCLFGGWPGGRNSGRCGRGDTRPLRGVRRLRRVLSRRSRRPVCRVVGLRGLGRRWARG